ncbi:MAG: hypothetical protein Q8Q60_05295 [Candidatus Chromulinivorax sp.]|nr:hypothetical protein [Candidatus Chromulinivorax sp.]
MKKKLLWVVFFSFISGLSVYGMGDKNNQNSMDLVGSMTTENNDLSYVDFDGLLNNLNIDIKKEEKEELEKKNELHASRMVRVSKSVNIQSMIYLNNPSSKSDAVASQSSSMTDSSPRSIMHVPSRGVFNQVDDSEVNNAHADYDGMDYDTIVYQGVDSLNEKIGVKRSCFCFLNGFESEYGNELGKFHARKKSKLNYLDGK